MRKLVPLICLLALLTACAAPEPKPAPDNVQSRNFAAPPSGSLIVLLPPPGSREIAAADNFLNRQLTTQLQSAGYQVSTFDRQRYNELWSQEVAAVGGIFDAQTGAAKPQAHAVALSRLARRICSDGQCALLLHPRIVRRSATLKGSVAEWDGQRKEIPLKGNGSRDYRFTGNTLGLSVELVALTADGKLGFRTFGGISLPYQSDVHEKRSELRTDLFSDDRDVASGVRIVLEPLTGKS